MTKKINYFSYDKIFKQYEDRFKTFIVIGSKNIGKTYSFLERAIKRWEKYGEKFIIIFRQVKQVMEYWDDETSSSGIFKDYTYKKNLIFDPEGVQAGKIIAINGSTDGKGKSHLMYINYIFDDFIAEDWERPIDNFSNRLYKIINNHSRSNLPKARLYMSGNNNNPFSEYLNENEFELAYGGGYTFYDDVNTIIYNEGKNTSEGMFASHLKDYQNTIMATAMRSAKNRAYYMENMSGWDTWLKVKSADVGPFDPDLNYDFCVQKRIFTIGWAPKLQKWIIVPNDKPEYHRVIYAFNAQNTIVNRWVKVNTRSVKLAHLIIDKLTHQHLGITDMSMVRFILNEALSITTRETLYGENKIVNNT